MLLAVLMATTIEAGGPGTPDPSPPYAALTSPTESARYALVHGCLAAARAGVRLAEVPNHFLLLIDKKRGIYRMSGAGHVTLSDSDIAHPGCYTSVEQGKAEALRALVLELLAAEGPLRPLTDGQTLTPDGKARVRQELLCVTIAGRPVTAFMSTTDARQRRALQLSLVDQPNTPCAKDAGSQP